MSAGRWGFLAAAAVPCAVLLVFCAIGMREWWLIGSGQIVVIPTPAPGSASAPEVPTDRLALVVLGSGALAALFAYALVRGSKRTLVTAWLVVGVLIGAAVVRRML